MAKKKQTYVDYLGGYIPAGSYSPTITESQINLIPPYEDSGIRYQGFAKQEISKGQYKLIKQTPINSPGSLAVGTTTIVTITNPRTTFFLTDFWFNQSGIYAIDLQVDGLQKWSASGNTADLNQKHIHFDIPLKITSTLKSTWVDISGGSATNYSIAGWAEQN